MYFTKKQLHILEFICRWREEKGVSPTLEEMATHFGVTKITIFEHLNQLEKKGAIRRDKFRARSIEVLEPPPTRRAALDALPLLGFVQAGAGAPAAVPPSAQRADTLCLADLFPLEGNCFALRVQGDSMGENILDGDYVVVEGKETAQDGDAVVAVLENGEATLKRYFREPDRVRLQPDNPARDPIYARNVQIRGVVVGLLRRFKRN
jgi:repressor LexA